MAAEGRLTTHVLDTTHGKPAAGMSIQLFRLAETGNDKLQSVRTNADGRCDGPLLEGEALQRGTYELHFHVAAYYQAQGLAPANGPFLDIVPVRFMIADERAHYHVPLLVSPYGYSTYRGS